jgi:hypothetical protein
LPPETLPPSGSLPPVFLKKVKRFSTITNTAAEEVDENSRMYQAGSGYGIEVQIKCRRQLV